MTVITQENKSIQIQELDSKRELIKRLYFKGCTEDEIDLFMHVCKRTGLDPLAKQIYPIKRGGQLTNQVGIDGLRLVGDRTGNYSPGRESTFTYDDKGHLLSATSYIKKRTSDGVWHEVAATAYLDEYNAKQGCWGKMPRAMLSKCAEALALRKAFPAEMSGVYTKDEMDQADATPAVTTDYSLDEPITTEQNSNLIEKLKLINDEGYRNRLEEHCLQCYGVTNFTDINQRQYNSIIKSVEKRLKQKEEQDESSRVA